MAAAVAPVVSTDSQEEAFQVVVAVAVALSSILVGVKLPVLRHMPNTWLLSSVRHSSSEVFDVVSLRHPIVASIIVEPIAIT